MPGTTHASHNGQGEHGQTAFLETPPPACIPSQDLFAFLTPQRRTAKVGGTREGGSPAKVGGTGQATPARWVAPGRRYDRPPRQAIRPTLRNRIFGSLAEFGARHRRDTPRWMALATVGGTDKRWMAPTTVGGTDKQWVAPTTVGGTGNSGWHRQQWVAPATVDGTRQQWMAPGNCGWHPATVGGTRQQWWAPGNSGGHPATVGGTRQRWVAPR